MEKEKDQVDQQDSQKFKIKVQGEEKEYTQTELLELAQKGVDYTQKTQSLAEDRKKMEEETRRQAEELASNWIEQEEAKKPAPVDENLDPQEKRIAELEARFEKMAKGSEESKVAQYELRFETQLKDLKGKYPDLDERVVLATMMSNPELKMEDVAKDSHETETKKKDDIIKQYLDDKKKQPKAEAGGPSSVPLTPVKDLTGKDLMKGDVKRAATQFVKESMKEE